MEREVGLAGALAEAGLPLIAIPREPDPAGVPATMDELVTGLIRSPDALFRLAVVPLLLCNREARRSAAHLARTLEPAERNLLAHLYTAAAALRRLWKRRLRLCGIEDGPEDPFSRELGLPDPSAHYGELCLREIGERLDRGEAGPRIRGADRLIAKLVRETFGILERRARRATPR